MPVEHIDTTMLNRSLMSVRVIHVISPFLFWVQPKCNRELLLELQEELTWKMEKRAHRYTMWPDSMKINQNVAVKTHDTWCRRTISHISNNNITVNLDDWDKTVKKPSWNIYQLPEELHWMPWQTIPCGLYGVRSCEALANQDQEINKTINGRRRRLDANPEAYWE